MRLPKHTTLKAALLTLAAAASAAIPRTATTDPMAIRMRPRGPGSSKSSAASVAPER